MSLLKFDSNMSMWKWTDNRLEIQILNQGRTQDFSWGGGVKIPKKSPTPLKVPPPPPLKFF